MSDAPVSPEQRLKLKGFILEMTRCLERMDAEREAMKDIADRAHDEFSIQKKYINRVARTMYKQDYADQMQENSHFEDLYEAIAEGKQTD